MNETDKLSRIEIKLDRVSERIGSIDVTLGKQHVSLKDHIRRTEILEQQLEPIKKHVSMVHGALKFLGLIGILAGVVEGIMSVVNHIK